MQEILRKNRKILNRHRHPPHPEPVAGQRGGEVANGAELVMGEEWVVNNSVGVPIFVARNAPASNGNSVGVQYFSGQSRHPMEVSVP